MLTQNNLNMAVGAGVKEEYKHRGSEGLGHVTQPNGKSGEQKVECVGQSGSCRTYTLFFSWKRYIFYTDDISAEHLTPAVSSLKKQSFLTPVTVGMNCYETLILALLSNRIFQNNLKHKHLTRRGF